MKAEIIEENSEVIKYPRLYYYTKKVGVTKKKLFKKQEPIYRKFYQLYCEPYGFIDLPTGDYITGIDEMTFSRCNPDEEVEIETYFCDLLLKIGDNTSLYIQPKNFTNKLVRITPECCPDLIIDQDNRENYKKITKGTVKISENS
jgi:hypothetical protein